MTARTTPTYLLCWFALASLGAVTVPTDPSGTAQELAGLVAQVQPRVVVTDAAMHDVMSASGIADAATLLDIDVLLGDWRRRSNRRRSRPVGHGYAGRSRRADPDVRHHRPVEARHADAPGVRDGRRGVPVLDGARRAPIAS